jgi:hypothetical protein
MAENQFDRDNTARYYAKQHLKTDPGIQEIYYLPTNAPEREIRFVEINNLIVNRDKDPIEPIDFGVDMGSDTAHQLMIVDITPAQWEKIQKNELRLPKGWSLDNAIGLKH